MPRPSSRSKSKPKKEKESVQKPSIQEKKKPKTEKPVPDRPSRPTIPQSKPTPEQRKEFWTDPKELAEKKQLQKDWEKFKQESNKEYIPDSKPENIAYIPKKYRNEEKIKIETEKSLENEVENINSVIEKLKDKERNKNINEEEKENLSSLDPNKKEEYNSLSLSKPKKLHLEKKETPKSTSNSIEIGGITQPKSGGEFKILDKNTEEVNNELGEKFLRSEGNILEISEDKSNNGEILGETYKTAIYLYDIPSYDLLYISKITDPPRVKPPKRIICFDKTQAFQIQNHFHQSIITDLLIDKINLTGDKDKYTIDEIYHNLDINSIHQSKIVDIHHYLTKNK